MTKRTRRVAVLLALCSIGVASCSPPLRVGPNAKGVLIDVQTMSNYTTSISRLRLTEQLTGRVIWELAAVTSAPQFNTVQLIAGTNAALLVGSPSDFKYRIVTPAGSDTFQLKEGIAYQIEVWGERSWNGPARATFELRGPK